MTREQVAAAPLRAAAVAALVFAGVGTLLAQEPAPANLSASSFSGDGMVEFTLAWRFRSGDDPAWSDPDLDDSAWTPVDPRLPSGSPVDANRPGAGWFRRHIRVAADLRGVPLLARVEAAGDAEVFLDGRPVFASGVAGVTPQRPAATISDASRALAFSGVEDHVLAVRYRWRGGGAPTGATSGRGFHLMLEDRAVTANLLVARVARQQFHLWLRSVFTAVPIFLGLLHVGLFSLLPKRRENLFYGFWMLAFSWVVITDLGRSGPVSESWRAIAERTNIVGVAGVVVFLMLTYYTVRTRPVPVTVPVFVVLAACLTLGPALWPAEAWAWPWHAYMLAVTADVVRIEVTRKTVRRDFGPLLLAAMAFQWVVLLLVSFSRVRLLPELFGESIYFIIVLPFAIAMSFCLVADFARTNTQLERKLAEVQSLSTQVLEQEREAHARELRARLLEADNARKTAELEAARALQLSMLPSSLPTVAGLEVGAVMATATEVGGDYYDFRALPDGGLLMAIGDATGHGAAAGIVVTAVKTLFSSVEGDPDLAGFMTRCSKVLATMHPGSVHMCLALARIGRGRAVVCSAGMPPLLIRRAGGDTIDEITLGGLPLGSRLAAAYEERSVTLASGDTLLLSTDGLSEQPNPDGAPLGFDGVASLLTRAAELPAPVLVEHLMTAARNWRGDREQVDDITLVALRLAAAPTS
ncbi:MAG TPA: SpoIIE family protein phosphatase [Thermoanaerobaculaceae bacterium]|nr:SpoIIE family protein phosphatase [Thermoanaerobaculaceae bacterium]